MLQQALDESTPLASRADDEAHCPVCAASIEGPPVHCTSCQTPHHPECFDYNQVCAIYACAQTEAYNDGLELLRPTDLQARIGGLLFGFGLTLVWIPLQLAGVLP